MVLLVLLGFGALVLFHLAVFSLLIAIVVDTAVSPAVEALRQRGLPRPAGVGLVYFGAVALIVVLGLLSAPLLAEQAVHFAGGYVTYYQGLRLQLLASSNGLLQRLAPAHPRRVRPSTGWRRPWGMWVELAVACS